MRYMTLSTDVIDEVKRSLKLPIENAETLDSAKECENPVIVDEFMYFGNKKEPYPIPIVGSKVRLDGKNWIVIAYDPADPKEQYIIANKQDFRRVSRRVASHNLIGIKQSYVKLER